MIRKYKKTLILTSLLTLLPMLVGLLLWNKLPDTFATHWGFDGQPDGWSSIATAVFGMPLIMLAVHWLCTFFTAKDKSNQDRNEKLQVLVFWIIPILSNLSCGLMYALALGSELSITNVMFAFMGLLFAFIGNYMPKCKMNSTIGIKIYWTYTSEENWNATHRFGGRIWFVGGLLMLFVALLPAKYVIGVFLTVTAVMVIVPVLYSWRYYRKQVQQGDELLKPQTVNGKASKTSLVALALVLILTAFLMFAGNIEVVFGEESFTIEASFHDDLTVAYDAIDTVEYRKGNVEGYRIMGYGSARLLLGTFENEEFGRYTRYTYTNPESCIVLTAGDQVLVFCGKDAQETQNIYSYLAAIMRNQ